VDAFVAAVGREGWHRSGSPALTADDLSAITAPDRDDAGTPLRVIDSF